MARLTPAEAVALLEAEREVATRIAHRRKKLPTPANEAFDSELSFGQRVADLVATGAGSWTFIFVFLGALGAWMAWNATRGDAAVDPFPFILLNLMLSCVAALQAPVIMMSQNRQAARDRLHADLDYEVNVRAEAEIFELKAQMDDLRRQQWGALLAMQKEQLELLRKIADDAAP